MNGVTEATVEDAALEWLDEIGWPTAYGPDAYRTLTRPEGATLEVRNRAFHRLVVEGVAVEYQQPNGGVRSAQVQVVDFDNPANNDWLAVSQFTVVENKRERRRIWCCS